MDENIQDQGITENANSTPAEDSPVGSMPDSEQKPTEEADGFGELPSEVADRTKKEFEKLKSHNKEMAEKLKKYEQAEYGNSVFDSLQGNQKKSTGDQQINLDSFSHLTQGQANQIAQGFVDQQGNVDINALNKALVDANRRAATAEQRARQTEQRFISTDQRRQEREAHEKHPWLNPKSESFDKKGFELVRDRLLRNMYEGREESLLDVAEEITQVYKPQLDVSKEKEKAVSEYKEAQAKKAQASAVTPNKGQPRQNFTREELRERTFKGDLNAIDARIEAATKV